MHRNGGFGTFLRAFYASLERRRLANPSVAAVAFGGNDDEWASLQVKSNIGNHKFFFLSTLISLWQYEQPRLNTKAYLDSDLPCYQISTPLPRWACIPADMVISHHVQVS